MGGVGAFHYGTGTVAHIQTVVTGVCERERGGEMGGGGVEFFAYEHGKRACFLFYFYFFYTASPRSNKGLV